MAKADNNRQLNIKQENAIDLLLIGKTDKETAQEVGVSRQTVNDWRNNDSLFEAELNRRRKEVWGSQLERLRNLLAQAVVVLEEDLQTTDERRLRQSAAVHVLKSVGLYGFDLTPTGATDPEGIEGEKRNAELMNELLRF